MQAPGLQESVDACSGFIDKACDSDASREQIASKGMKLCITPRVDRPASAAYDTLLALLDDIRGYSTLCLTKRAQASKTTSGSTSVRHFSSFRQFILRHPAQGTFVRKI